MTVYFAIRSAEEIEASKLPEGFKVSRVLGTSRLLEVLWCCGF